MHRLQDQTDVFAAGNDVNNPESQACPSCEYERASRGKPVFRDGKMHCLECGGSWKELGNTDFAGDTAFMPSPTTEIIFPNARADAVPPPKSLNPTNDPGWARKRAFGLLTCSFLLIAGIGITLILITYNSANRTVGGLRVASVEFEELVRGDLGKVIRVKGTIANSGDSSERVPRIMLVLKKANGGELTRWYYNSPVVKLVPGGKTRFVSSIQYDTPFIASVEALFE